jgi:hypothetical protein|tara:strand:- start:60 stop:623 length:564 start_codon:yes stop_codon:yes gene_type:complete
MKLTDSIKKLLKINGYDQVWKSSTSVIYCKKFDDDNYLGFCISKSGHNKNAYYAGFLNVKLAQMINTIEDSESMGIYNLTFYHDLSQLGKNDDLYNNFLTWIEHFQSEGTGIVRQSLDALRGAKFPEYFSIGGIFESAIASYYHLAFKLVENEELASKSVIESRERLKGKNQNAMLFKFDLLLKFVS